MDPERYARVYGPTTGDRIQLADTGLIARVEHDSQRRGTELLTGFGRTARDGIHLQAVTVEESCDLVVTNAVVLDPVLGCVKTSIGVRAGRISAIGRAGNPDTMDGVEVVVGTGTTIVSGEGLIATPGAIDTHVHLLSPRVLEAELSSGVTTVLGQEIGPVWGVGISSPWALHTQFAAFDAWPVNVGMLARGSSSRPGPLEDALTRGGACGFKVHEDLGAHRSSLATALDVAEAFDVQVALHTDGLNESLSVEDTLAVLDGRTIHAFHVEGCGGGHAPNVLRLAGVTNVIGSSTNPTLPYGRDAVAEHAAMIAAVHGLTCDIPSDEPKLRDRVRAGTMSAESVLHDLGVIPITSSDAQGMGRAGETVRRTFAMASWMKEVRGPHDPEHPDDDSCDDNWRILRYLAKLTLNPAIAHGLSHEVGSISVGKLADIVLWQPARFGATPELVLKGGFPAWGPTGDPNAVVPTGEPLVIGPQFGGSGAAPAELSVVFVSGAFDEGTSPLPTHRRRVAIRGTRGIGLAQMVRNSTVARVDVDPRDGSVTLETSPIGCPPAERISLSRLYSL